MVDITESSAIVAAAGVLVGVVYYIFDMRHQRQVRQTDLIMKLYSHYGSVAFEKAVEKVNNGLRGEALSFNDYVEKYGYAEWVSCGTFFEGVGLLLYRRLIDMSMVDDLFTSPTDMAWNIMKDSIIEARKQWGQPTIFEWFEYLNNELKKREQKTET